MVVRQSRKAAPRSKTNTPRRSEGRQSSGARRDRGGLRASRALRMAGLGEIDASGVKMRAAFAAFDAEKSSAWATARERRPADPLGCRCGDVLKGSLSGRLPAIRRVCNPETPAGALMVSTEGACAAYHQYAGMRARGTRPRRPDGRHGGDRGRLGPPFRPWGGSRRKPCRWPMAAAARRCATSMTTCSSPPSTTRPWASLRTRLG